MTLSYRSIAMVCLLVVGMGVSSGCSSMKKSMHAHFFPEEKERKVAPVLEAQVAKAAREDATLRPMHFDGDKLNSLGTQKLTRVAGPKSQQNVVVFLDVPSDAMLAARREAVTGYMSVCGVEAARLKLEDGYNPNSGAFSADGLAHISRTETGETAASTSGGAPASGMAAAAK